MKCESSISKNDKSVLSWFMQSELNKFISCTLKYPVYVTLFEVYRIVCEWTTHRSLSDKSFWVYMTILKHGTATFIFNHWDSWPRKTISMRNGNNCIMAYSYVPFNSILSKCLRHEYITNMSLLVRVLLKTRSRSDEVK